MRHRRLPISLTALAATLILGAPFAAPVRPAAAVQISVNRPLSSPIAQVTQPDYTRRDRSTFVAGLELDDVQQAVLDVALARYERDFNAAVAAYRAAARADRPAASSPSAAYTETQESMRRRMRAVIDAAREAAADAATAEEAAQIRSDALAEVEELRQMLAERLAEFGPEAEARAAVDATMQRMRENAVELDRTRHALGRTLLSTIRESLMPSQAERWPAFERALVRRTIPRGRLAGESLDLAELLVRTVSDEDARTAAERAVEAWSIEVDAHLRERNLRVTELAVALTAAEMTENASAAAGIRSQQVALHLAVRDANIRGMTAIAAALPADAADAFIAAAQRRSFPSIERELPEDRLFDAALDDVADEPELRRAMLDILDAYDTARQTVDGRLRQLTLDEEPATMRVPAAVAGPDQLPESRLAAAFRERRTLGETTIARVRDLLGVERFSALPGARRWMRR